MSNTHAFGRHDICVIGGAGHVGLPLALAFAGTGHRVLVHDLNVRALETIAAGVMPFVEQGAETRLSEALANGRLSLSSEGADVAGVPILIVTVDPPVDDILNPSARGILGCVDSLLPFLSDQLVILRSTLSPGTTERLDRYLRGRGKRLKVAFCPERVAQGRALQELFTLPQIVSGTTPEAEAAATALFLQIAPEVVRLEPMEAELAKLFCNAYRYIQFGAVNQCYMMASAAGLDGHAILDAVTHHYPRMSDVPRVGLAAGPCLPKDTMQLNAFSNNTFSLGHAARLVNEGLPLHIAETAARMCDLSRTTVGLFGMAFKAESDDARWSLSYKVKETLLARAKHVLTTDPFVRTDPDLLPVDEVLARSDLLVVCTPHRAYRSLEIGDKPLIDVWNVFGKSREPIITPSLAAGVAAGSRV